MDLKSLGARGCVVTIGNFDGVHVGHQKLLENALEKSRKLAIPLVAVIFEPQPQEFFQRDIEFLRIMSLREKILALKKISINNICCLKFNAKLARLSPESFVKKILVEKLNCRHIFLGGDFKFGYMKTGNIKAIKKFSLQYNFAVTVLDNINFDNSRISSTKLREVLSKQDLTTYHKICNRDYFLCARVIKGQGIGRTIGFPTANLNTSQRHLFLNGVFCVKVFSKKYQQNFKGVANIGVRPTLNGNEKRVEIHLFETNNDFYHDLFEVKFLKNLRFEKKFDGLPELINQINNDIIEAQKFFLAIN